MLLFESKKEQQTLHHLTCPPHWQNASGALVTAFTQIVCLLHSNRLPLHSNLCFIVDLSELSTHVHVQYKLIVHRSCPP